MKRILILLWPTLLVATCLSNPQSSPPATATVPNTETSPTDGDLAWAVYDADPVHLWNRMFRQFYRRVANDGTEYGMDELDPLLWYDTTYLLFGDPFRQSIQVLDEFLTTHGENMIHIPLKRAMFQRDIWAVFDWLAFQPAPYPTQRLALKTRLAQVIERVALPGEQILSLPDNYALTVESGAFPRDFEAENAGAAFLPTDLFEENSAWVPMGRTGGPIALSHTKEFPFLGRSVFLVFVRAPEGRQSTLDLIESLNTEPQSVLTLGLDVALVRRMLLIDNQGELIPSPLIETVQIRHFNPGQIFHEFELSRKQLLAESTGSLQLNKELFLLFFSHGDVLEMENIPEFEATIPHICKGCHFEDPPLPNPGNIQSILSYSRNNFPLPDNQRPVLISTTWANETQTVIEWKYGHDTWRALEALLR